MNSLAKSAIVVALAVIATVANAETLQERFERAQKALIDAGTNKDHIKSISLIAQLNARDRVCPPDDRVKAYMAWETAMQAEQTGLTREDIVLKAEAFVPLMVEALNSDPAEKAVACMP